MYLSDTTGTMENAAPSTSVQNTFPKLGSVDISSK
jgi:hypothetical protein